MLLGASPGATMDEMMVALGWQSHTVRGFLSNLNKSVERIESFRREDGRRAYRLARINGAEPTSVADETPESRCTDVDR